MRSVTELYDRHPGADIYVVGTGTSMRVFPPTFLEGRITIGLNMAWRVAPVTYGITIGPHLNIPEFLPGEQPRPEIIWITKGEKAAKTLPPEQFVHADRQFYSFEIADRNPTGGDWVHDGGRVLDYVREASGPKLYQWSSISQTAVNLAANMGARNVIVVGCDNASLAGNHHSHVQHTKWLGRDPEDRYRQYYEGLAEVRAALRGRGVTVVSLSPFLKLDDAEGDFVRLCRELEQPDLLTGPDISEQDHPRRFGTPSASGGAGAVARWRSLGGTLVRRATSRRTSGT